MPSTATAVTCRHRAGQYSSSRLRLRCRQNRPSLVRVGRPDSSRPWMRLMRSENWRRSRRAARAREFQTGRIPLNLTANVSASLQARADLGLLFPTYTFATPVFGGQLTLGAAGVYGRESTSLAGTVSAALATPLGTFPFSRFDNISESVWGFGDLLPMATLRRSQLHDIHHRRHTGRSL